MELRETSINNQELQGDILPVDVNTFKKLERYLSLQEDFQNKFILEDREQEEVIEDLNENDDGLLYRGMSPEYIFELILGKEINISPFRHSENLEEGNSRNASYSYSRAIPFGVDEEGRYRFLSAIGFKPGEDAYMRYTGRENAYQLVGQGNAESLVGQEQDVSIMGIIHPEEVSLYAFRFSIYNRKEKKYYPKTLFYRRKTE